MDIEKAISLENLSQYKKNTSEKIKSYVDTKTSVIQDGTKTVGGVSTDDYNAFKSAVEDSHIHSNMSVLDEIDESVVKGGNSLSGSTSYTVTNSVEYPLVGLKVFGKSTQDGTPTPENPVDIVSVVEPTVTVCGKNLLNISGNRYLNDTNISADSVLSNLIADKKTNFSLRVMGSGWDRPPELIYEQIYTTGNYSYNFSLSSDCTIYVKHNGSSNDIRLFSLNLSAGNYVISFNCMGINASVVDGIKLSNIQIEKGSTATDYEPYVAKSLTISDTLNAIPVSSGGNVTIDGQEYIADYKDYGTGKYHRLVDPDKLDPTVSIVDNLDLLLASEEITDIPETELQAYRQLHTYNGVTNISNNKGAGLSVEYCTNKMLAEYALPLIKDLEAKNAKKDEEISVLKTDILNNEKIHNRIYEGVNLSEKFASEIAASPYNSDVWTWIKARITVENFTGIRVGDYIPFATTNGVTLNAQIAGINTYKNYGDTAVGSHIDFICKELWGTFHPINKVNYNNGTTNQNHPWLASDLYLYLNSLSGNVPNGTAVNPETVEVDYTAGGVYYYLPDALKNVIIEKRFLLPKRYSASGLLTDDNQWGWTNIGKLWLPDECEVYGTPMWGGKGFSAGGSGLQYPLFAGNMNRVKFRNGSRSHWWLLSPSSGKSSYWCGVDYYGCCNHYDASYGGIAVPVCFRV